MTQTATENNFAKMNQVLFNNDELYVIKQDDDLFVPLKPICTNMGLDWESLRQLIDRDPVLTSTACIIQVVAQDEKHRDMLCLPLSHLNGWLFKINPTRYQGERRKKIIQYQKECYQVLYRHFFAHARKQADKLKQRTDANRLELNYIKTIKAMKKEAKEYADLIIKGNGSIDDLDLCPKLQVSVQAIIDEENQGSLFPVKANAKEA